MKKFLIGLLIGLGMVSLIAYATVVFVPQGGTGASSFTQYPIVGAGGTGAFTSSSSPSLGSGRDSHSWNRREPFHLTI